MGADAAIDLPAATAAYATGTDGTVGIEEEFMLLDEATLDLVPRFEELSASTAKDPVLAVSVAGELIRTEIEIRSGRGEHLGEALEAQRVHRDGLFAHAARMGIRLGATGTHPWDDYRHQTFIDTEHYRRVVDGLRWVARRNATFSLHVHVGIRDPDRAIAVCDRLRPVLPMLLALSAVHQRLLRAGRRTKTALVVDSGEVREDRWVGCHNAPRIQRKAMSAASASDSTVHGPAFRGRRWPLSMLAAQHARPSLSERSPRRPTRRHGAG